MTQDKLRRIITACVSAATVLLVLLLGYLIYQWVTMAVLDKKIDKVNKEITQLEQQLDENNKDKDYYLSDFYLNWKLEEMDLIKDK